MVIIAIIEKNRVTFDDLGKYASDLLYQFNDYSNRKRIKESIDGYLWSVVAPYITFQTIDEDCLLPCVCQELVKPFNDKNPETDFYYHCVRSYCTPKKCFEMLYCEPLWEDYPKNNLENMNVIGCYAHLDQHVVENRCVMIANNYDLTSNHGVQLGSICQKDILKVIKKRFYFSAVLIGVHSCIKYYYRDPSILIQKLFHCSESDTIEKLETTHLHYNLVFYFRKKATLVNPMATRINGLYSLCGDVLVLHQTEESIFANLSVGEIMHIDKLSHNPNSSSQFNGYDGEHWHKYLHLIRAIDGLECNECTYCKKIVQNIIVCSKCYRVKHCAECVSLFNENHPKPCLSAY